MKSIHDFLVMKKKGQLISMVTCYDASFAKILDKTAIDCLLVGDSVAMVQHGFESTLFADTQMMSTHCKAVRRGSPNKFVICDLPFLAHRKGLDNMMNQVEKIMKSGANAIKIEINTAMPELRYVVESGVPAVAHLGLTPQSIHQMGGYKVQGKTLEQKSHLLKLAKHCEEMGAFMLVIECVPQELAKEISKQISIPVIGIGAGMYVDGQVLVINDLLGLNPEFNAKFIRRFANTHSTIENAVNAFVSSVNEKTFPSNEEAFL